MKLIRRSSRRSARCHAFDASRFTFHASAPALGGPAPSTRCATPESAIALVIVMISIFVLTILAGGFAYSMKVETRLARNANSECELEWLARSAVECARWELMQSLKIPNEPYDALNQVWAGGVGGLGTSNSPLADFKQELEVENGKATWTIIDHERFLNINTVNEAVLQQALMMMGADAADMTPVVNSILDWIDPDNNTRIQGAEKTDYQGEVYTCKNGPIDDLSELLLVKGVTPELYWGNDSTNVPPLPTRQQFGRPRSLSELPAFTAGLVNLFTPISRGSFNINTCSAEVLQCIPGVDAMSAQAIVGARGGEDDGTGLLGPYRSVDQVRRAPEVGPQVPNLLRQFGADVRSYTFEVQVEASANGYTRHFTAVLGRTPQDVQILSFHWTE